MKTGLSIGFSLAVCLLPCHEVALAFEPQPVVVDANGTVVGPLIGQDLVTFRLKPTNLPVVMTISKPGFYYFEGSSYDYPTTDCSGPAYISFPGLLRRAYIEQGNPDVIIYPGEPLTTFVLKSQRYIPTGQCFGVPNNEFAPRTAGPAQSTTVSAQGFVAPFRGRLQ